MFSVSGKLGQIASGTPTNPMATQNPNVGRAEQTWRMTNTADKTKMNGETFVAIFCCLVLGYVAQTFIK